MRVSMLSARMPLSNSLYIQRAYHVVLPISPQDRSETTALRGLCGSQFTVVHHELSPSQKEERVEPLIALRKCFNRPNKPPRPYADSGWTGGADSAEANHREPETNANRFLLSVRSCLG
jgi:hypothetical protein